MIEAIMKLAQQQADSVEVYALETSSCPVNFYNWRGIDVISRDLKELSLRVVRNGKLGVATGSLPLNPQEFVQHAVRAADVGPKVAFEFAKPEPATTSAQITDPALEHLEVEAIVADGAAIYDYVRRQGGDVNLNLYFDNEFKRVTIANSNGAHAQYSRTMYTASLLSMYEGSKEGINKEFSACRYFKIPEAKIDEMISENQHSQIIVQAPTKKMDVIFRASAMWALLYRVLEGANGANFIRDLTPLKDKIGHQIVGTNVTLIDDPAMDYAPGSTPYDDEGVPTAPKMIIEAGVFKNFIFDLDSGARSGSGSSGNGVRRSMWMSGIDNPPAPRFNNLVMQPGTVSLADMIADMEEGLIVNEVIGFHSGNILQGHYSMSVGMGFYVKDGVIQGRVMDTMIAGNIYEDFYRIKHLGNELERNNLAYSPDIYVTDVSVSGKA